MITQGTNLLGGGVYRMEVCKVHLPALQNMLGGAFPQEKIFRC